MDSTTSGDVAERGRLVAWGVKCYHLPPRRGGLLPPEVRQERLGMDAHTIIAAQKRHAATTIAAPSGAARADQQPPANASPKRKRVYTTCVQLVYTRLRFGLVFTRLRFPYTRLRFGLVLKLVLLVLFSCTGCRTFSQRGPVPEAVANCRQLSQQGTDSIHQGQWEQAETLLAQAVAACDTNPEARRQYAETLWHRGASKEALAQMEAALRLTPENAELHCRMGEMCLALHEYERANVHVAQAMQRDGKLASAWALRGRLHHAAGRSSQALADMQRALCYSPEDAAMLLSVAELQREAAQPQRALATLLALADLYPPGEEPQEVLYLTGLALTAMGRHADAAEHLYAASQRGEPTAEILYRLAEAELLSGRTAAAEANARQALSLNPQHIACHELLERLSQTRTAARP